MKTAICITTRNREKVYEETFSHWLNLSPDDFKIFVVDDCSDIPYAKADFRFEERAGIPKAKNKCLELAYKWGADHIFLSDDDCYPVVDYWYKPYIESGLNHLCFTFTTGFKGTLSWSKGFETDKYIIHSLGCGCMMYFSRLCLDTVGGFDEKFGLGKYEHPDLSRRIHNAGLTPHTFMDVKESNKLFHSMDQHNEIERSFTPDEQNYLLNKGRDYFYSKAQSREYIEFKG